MPAQEAPALLWVLHCDAMASHSATCSVTCGQPPCLRAGQFAQSGLSVSRGEWPGCAGAVQNTARATKEKGSCVSCGGWDMVGTQGSAVCLPGNLPHRTPFHWRNKRLFLSVSDLRKKKKHKQKTKVNREQGENVSKNWALRSDNWEVTHSNDIRTQKSYSWSRASTSRMS